MLRAITTTHRPATDLGYLLHKHSDRFQSYDLSIGRAHVIYPEADEDHCTACLLLDVDPVGVVRGKGSAEGRCPSTSTISSGTGPRASPDGIGTASASCRSARWMRRSGHRRRWPSSCEPTAIGGEAVEAVIFVGLQGAGKSSFYRDRFLDSHLRLSLDMLRTRHRERRLLQACVETQLRFVVDNTNPTRAERQVYIRAAKGAGFRVIGYYFQSRVEDCRRRNEQRPAGQQVPLRGILGTAGRMELPSLEEGFDELHYVRIDESRGFVVEGWRDEAR